MEWKDGVLTGGSAEERTEEFEKRYIELVSQMLTHGISDGRLLVLLETVVSERRQVRLRSG